MKYIMEIDKIETKTSHKKVRTTYITNTLRKYKLTIN